MENYRFLGRFKPLFFLHRATFSRVTAFSVFHLFFGAPTRFFLQGFCRVYATQKTKIMLPERKRVDFRLLCNGIFDFCGVKRKGLSQLCDNLIISPRFSYVNTFFAFLQFFFVFFQKTVAFLRTVW